MKKFIVKISLFILASFIAFLTVISFAHERTDAFYMRFNAPRQSNLILGTSRAAQGVQPAVLSEQFNKPFFNYSFTLMNSPYGQIYLESIKKKLDPSTTDGVFILCVSPWSLSSTCKDPNNESEFRETESFLADMCFVNMKPNFEYLLKHFSGKYIDILKGDDRMIVHEDGWLEINIDFSKEAISKRTTSKVKQYTEEVLPNYKFSTKRLHYLEQTIEFLQEHGKVYLVRLPVCEEILSIENLYTDSFDKQIDVAINTSDGYFDLTPYSGDFIYSDGNHLSPESGIIVSQMIGDWILELSNP